MLYCKWFKGCFVLLLGLFGLSSYAGSTFQHEVPNAVNGKTMLSKEPASMEGWYRRNSYWHPYLIYHFGSRGVFRESGSISHQYAATGNDTVPIITKAQFSGIHSSISSSVYKGEFQGFKITGMVGQANEVGRSGLEVRNLAVNHMGVKLK